MSLQLPNSFRAGPDERGHFGIFGGRFVAETLMPLILELEKAYDRAKTDPAFRAELDACGPDLFGPRLDDAARALSSGYHVGLDVHACRHLLTCPFPSDGSWPISPTGASLRSSSSPAVMGRSTDSIRR